MECDVQKGWCRCGKFHDGKAAAKKRQKKAAKVKKPEPPALDSVAEPKKLKEAEVPEWKYPFGAPRVW